MSNILQSCLNSIYISVFFIFLSNLFVNAQSVTPANYSNYTVFSSADINPAQLADSKAQYAINLADGNLNISNDYLKWNAPFSLLSFFAGSVKPPYSVGGVVVWMPNFVDVNTSKTTVNLHATAKAIGPSFHIYSEKKKIGLQAGLNLRGWGNLYNTSEQFARHLVQIRPVGLFNTPITGEKFNFSAGRINEAYARFGKTFNDFDESAIKVGATIKYLYSNMAMAYNASDMDYQFQANVSSPLKNDIYFTNSISETYVAEKNFSLTGSWIFKDLLTINSLGKGIGIDIGFTYESRPYFRKYQIRKNRAYKFNPDKIEYDWKFGMSLIDVGFLRYKGTNVSVFPVNDSAPHLVTNADISTVRGPLLLKVLVENTFTTNPADYTSKFDLLMPATLNLFYDRKIRENVFITSYLSQKLLSNSSLGLNSFSYFGITPRLERKYYTVSIPFTAETNFKTFSVGLMARFYGLYVGTTTILPVINKMNPKSLNIHGGVFFPIYYRNNTMKNACSYPESELKRRKKIKFLPLRER